METSIQSRTRGLSAAQKRAMAEGRKRAEREREREAVARVRAFRRWLAKGSKLGDIPCVPTNADFAIAKRKLPAKGGS